MSDPRDGHAVLGLFNARRVGALRGALCAARQDERSACPAAWRPADAGRGLGRR